MTSSVEVENVRVIMVLTCPGQVRITVDGRKIQDVPLDITQERKGNDVTITITQTYPRAQSSRRVAFREPLALQGEFPSGTYTLRVNTYTTTFDM